VNEKYLLGLIAGVENGSNHPLAKAFEKIEQIAVENIEERAGLGLTAKTDGQILLVGSAKYLKENGIVFDELASVNTVVYGALDGKYLGFVEVGDKLREEAKETIEMLKNDGVKRFVLLTGDKEERARKTANEVGVYEINAELLPQEKLEKAEELKRQGALVYVGDGVNDAPVMKVADCAISMGKLGSAAAVEASDMVLVADSLKGLVDGKRIAKKTRKVVLENIVFSVVMKIAFMVLGVAGVLPLSLAVFGDVGVMLCAVLNSFRARKI
jgi:Cd2+/Zn2+-exporting ATPase